MSELDPRLHAYRPDLAEEDLRGRVEAARFVAGEPARLRRGLANLYPRPEAGGAIASQILAGERLQVFERKDRWAWVRNQRDGYVGYLRTETLTDHCETTSHVVTALRTPLYPAPDLKTTPRDLLPLCAEVAVVGERDGYLEIAGGGWVFAGHLAPLGETAPDYLATAKRFLGCPYLWGGRSALGLDCSALVQLAFDRAGVALPRDSDQQADCTALGARLPPDARPRRGDLIFWRGHVGFALDAETLLHASAGPMLVTREPLAKVDVRARQDSPEGMTVIRRPG
jgi:cell wall-associated NlpC family hydrolase